MSGRFPPPVEEWTLFDYVMATVLFGTVGSIAITCGSWVLSHLT